MWLMLIVLCLQTLPLYAQTTGTYPTPPSFFLPPSTMVGQDYVLHVSAILLRGGGVVSQHALQVTRPTARGSLRGLARSTPRGEVEGSGWGVSRPTPRGVPGSTPGGGGFQVHTGGGVSQHALRQTP